VLIGGEFIKFPVFPSREALHLKQSKVFFPYLGTVYYSEAKKNSH
jgi:hypothetical protein